MHSCVRAVPGNAELESNLGIALYFHGEYAKAAQELRRALADKKSLYSPHLFLGLALAHLGQPDAAVPALAEAVTLNGADPLAHAWLGYELTAQSHFEKAAEQLEIAARLQPDDQDIWFALGRCYLELGKGATTRLLHEQPDGGRAFQLAADQLALQGKTAKAIKLYEEAYRRRPDLGELADRMRALGGTVPGTGLDAQPTPAGMSAEEDAVYAQVLGWEAKARDSFAHVSRIDPDSYRAHQVLGDSAAAADHFDDAIPEYRLVLEKKPDLPGIHGELCNALSRTGRMQEAIRECDAEIRISPFSADAYTQAARVQLLVDDSSRAGLLLQKAIHLDRPPAATYKLIGKVYMGRKDYSAAVNAFNKYLAAEPKDASTYYLLARAYKAIGDTAKMNEAIAKYEKAANTNNSNQATSALDEDHNDALGEDSRERSKPL